MVPILTIFPALARAQLHVVHVVPATFCSHAGGVAPAFYVDYFSALVGAQQPKGNHMLPPTVST
jgi:hypothetical protein